MPTIDVQVEASADDGHTIESTGGYTNNAILLLAGEYSASGKEDQLWARFDNVTIPNGATIGTAYFSLYATYKDTGNAEMVLADDQSDPTAPTTYADHRGRTRTTAGSAAWAITAVNQWVNSPSITAVIQELVDSYDYSAGDHAIQILVDRHVDCSSYCGITARSFDGEETEAPKLYIEYTVGGAEYTETATVLIGVKPLVARTLAYSNIATVLIGVKPIASKVISLIRTATVLIGVKATGIISWGEEWVETALVYIGIKPIASRVLSYTNLASVLVGVKPIATRLMSYIHTALVQIGINVSRDFALKFDGINDKVDLPDNASLQNMAAKTVLIVFKAGGFTGTDRYLWYGNYWISPYGDRIFLDDNNNQLVFYLRNTDGDIVWMWTTFTPDAWTPAGYTWDGVTVHYYKNGADIGSPDALAGTLACTANLMLGSRGLEWFDDTIASICIWNRDLSATEVANHSNGIVATNGLVLWLKLNEGTGTDAGDSSGQGNDGVIDGAIWTVGNLPSTERLFSFYRTALVQIGVKSIANLGLGFTALVKVGIKPIASEVWTILLKFIELTLNLHSRAITLNLYARSAILNLYGRTATLSLYGRSIIANLAKRAISILMRTKR